MQAQAGEPQVLPGPLLAPGVEMIVYALPTQWRAREQGPHGQPVPLAAGFELVTNGPYHFGRVYRQPASPGPGGQVRQYSAGNHIFGQDFHEGGKKDGSHLKFPAFLEVFSVLRAAGYFLNSVNYSNYGGPSDGYGGRLDDEYIDDAFGGDADAYWNID